MKKGTKVLLLDNSKTKVNWGENDTPSDYLKIGETYTVDHIEVHSWHTKVYLEETPDKKFNSAHFKVIDNED